MGGMDYWASALTAHCMLCFLKYSIVLPDRNLLCNVAQEPYKAACISFLADVHKALKTLVFFLLCGLISSDDQVSLACVDSWVFL